MSDRRATPRAPVPPDVDAGFPEPPIHRLDRHRALAAFDWGALAAIGVSLVYGLLWAIELHFGLIAVAVMGGWVIGGAVAHGAWRGSLHVPSRRLRALAAVLGGAAWLGAGAVYYLIAQAVLPAAQTPLLERLSFDGFAEFLTGVYDLVHGIALATLAFFSWRSAR